MIQLNVVRAFIANLALISTVTVLPAAAEPPTFGAELGTGRIICTDDGDYTPKEDDPSYARAAAWDRQIFGEVDIPCYSPLTDLDAGIWKQSEPFSGADEEGNKADFRIYVLHDTYSWAIGSTVEIELNGVKADPKTIFEAPNFMDRFCSSNSAFAFGASSYEGPRAANERTALARSKTVANALTAVRIGCDAGRVPIVFGVNLGEHKDDPTCRSGACSAAQRRVIIISADEITTGANLPAALAKGIEEQRVFKGLDVENYSLFDISSF